jgi:hypothetical protein
MEESSGHVVNTAILENKTPLNNGGTAFLSLRLFISGDEIYVIN